MAVEAYELTIREAAVRLRDGRLTATALSESVLARIAVTEPRLNAYLTVTSEMAREGAARADAELTAGHDRGPLQGIPFALKDMFDVVGLPTSGGSRLLRERMPSEDAVVVEKLRAAGVVLTGKLNLHELAYGTTSVNPHFGPVRNPWQPDHVSGGSSGGGGAALAVGSCLGTLGTDTGGSVRIPAALCGVVGLMPTYGRVSRRGVLTLAWSLDHVGPIAKSVEDAALILNAIAGYDAEDPSSADVPVDDYTRDLGRDLRGVRVGLPRDPLWRDCDEEVTAVCTAAVAVLREQGASVTEVELPSMSAQGRGTILAAEAAAYHAERLSAQPDLLGESVRVRLERGSAVPAVTYINDQRIRRLLIEETRRVLRDVDVLVSPTTSIPAPTIEAGDPTSELARLTAPYDLTGIPAISVPCGFSSTGLPLGLMIGGRHFDEVTVLRVSHAYEQATTWWQRRPALPIEGAESEG